MTTDQQQADLDIARRLIDFGVPVFVAKADPSAKLGFRLPNAWHRTTPVRANLLAWRPGDALCAVMGHSLDLIDIDPRNGSDSAQFPVPLPPIVASAETPSGGRHLFVLSHGVRSRDGILPGVDFKGGDKGEGHGFAFIAPTVKPSKVTGELAGYRWASLSFDADYDKRRAFELGQPLAKWVRSLHGVAKAAPAPDGLAAYMDSGSRVFHTPETARGAIDRELNLISSWRPSVGINFRTTLLRAAFVLGGYVASEMEYDAERAQLELLDAVGNVFDNPDDDDRKWIAQGLADGQLRPFHVAERPPIPVSGVVSRDPWPGERGQFRPPVGVVSNQAVAEWVLCYQWPRWRHLHETTTWIVNENERWSDRPVKRLGDAILSDTVRFMPVGVTPDDPKDQASWNPDNWAYHWFQTFSSSPKSAPFARKIDALIVAGYDPSTAFDRDMDSDGSVLWAGGVPWSLTEPGARVDTELLTPHRWSAAITPDWGVATPVWDAFLAAVWPDAEVRRWAMRVLSIGATAEADAALPVLYGPAGRGKTSVIALIMRALGDYAHIADARLISKANAHQSIKYALKGRRLSFIDEGPRNNETVREALKELTGGGNLTGNAMGSNPVTFAPTHTLVMTSNDEPHITDDAIRRRIRAIPCEGDAEDVRLARRRVELAWKAEAPGVLANLMTDAAAWLADRDSALSSAAPVELQARTAEMAEGQDPVKAWVAECTSESTAGTKASALLTAFNEWGRGQAVKAFNPQSFGRALTHLGIGKEHRRDGWYRLVRLNVGGGFTGFGPPSAEVTASPVTETDLSPSSITPRFPRSEPVLYTPGDGLTDIKRSTHTTNQQHTHSYSSDRGDYRHPSPSADKTGADLHKQPVTATRDDSVTITESVETSLGKKFVTERTAPQLSRTATKARAKAEARQSALTEAAGPLLELPALVRRGYAPVSVSSAEAVDAVCAVMREEGSLTVDCETSGYPIGYVHYRLKTVQLGGAMTAVVFDPVTDAANIRWLLAEAPGLKAFNATADLAPIAYAGFGDHDAMWAKMEDVAIPAKLSDPAGTSNSDGLKDVSARLLGDAATAKPAELAKDALFSAAGWLKDVKKWAETPPARNGWHEVDPRCSTMVAYAASDVLDTAPLPALLPSHPVELLGRERRIQRAVSRIGTDGLRLDRERVLDKHHQFTTNRAKALADCAALGIPEPTPAKVAVRLAELGAPVPRTDAGNLSVRKGVIEPWAKRDDAIGETVRAVIDHRHWSTGLSLILNPWKALVEHGDGRVRSTIYTLGADTGRMSSVRQNMQQVSKEGGLRECIAADPGHRLISADFSGVEIRVMAALSGDPALKAIIEYDDAHPGAKMDLHWIIARMAYGSDATKANRYNVKSTVFGRYYGGGVDTLAEQAGETVANTQRVLDFLDQLAPRMTGWANHVKAMIKQGHCEFPTYSGRTIILDRKFPHKGPNFVIQGTARELTGDALLDWDDSPYGKGIVLPVHDEIVAQVAEDDAEAAQEHLLRCMTREIGGLAIRAAAGDGPSDHWWSAV